MTASNSGAETYLLLVVTITIFSSTTEILQTKVSCVFLYANSIIDIILI